MFRRRAVLISLLTVPAVPAVPAVPSAHAIAPVQALRFPDDHGAHPAQRTEWWYITGMLLSGARMFGFQVTFFRSTTGVAANHPSRFAANEIVFGHAALTDIDAQRLRHDQRVARSGFGVARAQLGDTHINLRDWHLARENRADGSRYRVAINSDSAGFRIDLQIDTTQLVLLQGEAGLSRKGPNPEQTSRYYSQPQLAAQGSLTLDGKALPVRGRAWLDHEWSTSFLDAQAVGWDWIGMNLDDGSALTAFRLRRADGSALYAGGSFRPAGKQTRNFSDKTVTFTPGRVWESPASRARYPVQWTVQTPVGSFTVRALLDNQELDSRSSTGAIYWEGLSELLDSTGQRAGLGYLELTGYAAAMQI